MRLKALLTGIALLTTACAGAGATVPSAPAQAPGAVPVPDTAFTTFDGATVSLAEYEGRPLVVNFWASWCPSCVAEMSAAFKPAQERFGDRVAFLGVNLQDERRRAVELVAQTGVLFDLAEDPFGELFLELGGIGMPYTVFVNAGGQIVEDHNGPLTEQQLVDLIEATILS